MHLAIYPGTFDPITNGHLDVLNRACHLFDEVIIAVAHNERKKPIFTFEQRMELIQENVKHNKKVRVMDFNGLTTAFAKKVGAVAIIRGLRAVSDFEFEFQMAQMNRQLDGEIETIFLMPNQDYFYTSSHIIKEVARFNYEGVQRFVPQNVLKALKTHFKH